MKDGGVQSFIDEKTGDISFDGGSDNRRNVSARSASRKFYISRDKSNLYSWKSRMTSANGTNIFYLRNDNSDEDLYIEEIFCFSDAKCDFDVKWVTGTPTGTTVTGINWNKNNGKTISVTALNSGVTGLTGDGDIIDIEVPAGTRQSYDFDGSLILGDGDAITITTDAIANVSINIIGGFE
ncbi:MAG: hypothetical protein JKY52_09305 [Flavobacteriales bacterium]|nr:hypothetical protein [Flavobacteriales bacterium]